MRKLILALTLALIYSLGALAQIPTNSSTKDFEYAEEGSVKSAGSGELFHRFYYWGLKEYDGIEYEVVRDDTTFLEVVFHVVEPMVESHFGVNRVHKERFLTYDLTIRAEKKNYSYRLNEILYKCIESDRKGDRELAGRLKSVKTPARASLLKEVDEVLAAHIASLKDGSTVDMTAEQEAEADAWEEASKVAWKTEKEERKTAKAQAEKEAAAAEKAAKEASEAKPESDND